MSARDGIVVLIHAKNAVDALSRHELRGIFTGVITNWSEVGGADDEIVVMFKGKGSATSVVVNTFLDITADQIKSDLVAAENTQMIKTVSLTPPASDTFPSVQP